MHSPSGSSGVPPPSSVLSSPPSIPPSSAHTSLYARPHSSTPSAALYPLAFARGVKQTKQFSSFGATAPNAATQPATINSPAHSAATNARQLNGTAHAASPTHRPQHPAHTPHASNGRTGGAETHARGDRPLSHTGLSATLPLPATVTAAAERDGDSADDDDDGSDERLWLTKSAGSDPFASYYSPVASPAAAKILSVTSPAALSASAPTPLSADSALVDRIGDRMLQQHNELLSQRILVDLQHAHDAEVLQLRVKLHKQEQQQRDQKAEHELALRTCKASLERALDDGHTLLQRVTELESVSEASRVELERVSVARVDERAASYSQIAELEKSIVLREERLQQRAAEIRTLTVQLDQLRDEDVGKDRRMQELQTKMEALQAKLEQTQSAKAAAAYISGATQEAKYSDAVSRSSAATLSSIAEASPDLVVGSASSSVSLQADFVSQLSQRDAQMQAERAAVQSQLSALKLTLTSVTQRAEQSLSEAAEAHSRQLAFMADRLVLETEAGVKLQRDSMEAARNRADMDKARIKEMEAEQATDKAGVTVHALQMKLLYAESQTALLSQALRLSESRVGVFELSERRCRSLEQSQRNFSHELMTLEADMLAARISTQTKMTEQIRMAEEDNAKQRLLLRSMRGVLKDAASGKTAGSASLLASPSRGSSVAPDSSVVSVPSDFLSSLSATNLRLGDELAAAKDQLRASDVASQKEKEAYLRRMSELFAQAEKERADATKHAADSQTQLQAQIQSLQAEIARLQSFVAVANEKASQSAHDRMPSLPELPPMPALPELPDLPSARAESPAFNNNRSASQQTPPASKPAIQRSLSVPATAPASAACVSSLLSPPSGDPLLSHQVHLRVLDYQHVLSGFRTQLDDAQALVAKLQREALPAGQLASVTQLQEQVASLQQQLATAQAANSTAQRSAIKDLVASMQSKHDAAITELKSQLSAQSLKHAHDLSTAESQQRQEVALVAVHLRSKQARVESLEASLAALEKRLNGSSSGHSLSAPLTSDGKELQVTRANAALAADISQHSLTLLQSRMQAALEEKTEQMRVLSATHARELDDVQSKHAATILTLSASAAAIQQQLNDKSALLQQLCSAFVGKESTLLLGAQSQVDSQVLATLIAAHEKRTAAQLSRIEGLQSELEQARRNLDLARQSESSATSDQTAALQLAHSESANLRMQLTTFSAAHEQQRERIRMLERDLRTATDGTSAPAPATLVPGSSATLSGATAGSLSPRPPPPPSSSSESSTLSSRLSHLLREEESKNVQLQAELLVLRRQLADQQLLSPTRLTAGAVESIKAEHAEEINAMRNAFAAERGVLQQSLQRSQHEWAQLESALRAEIAELQSQLASHSRARSMWEGQVEVAHTAYQQRIQATRTEMHSELQLAIDQLRDMRAQIADRATTISELRTHNAALVAQLHSLGWPLSPSGSGGGGGGGGGGGATPPPASVPSPRPASSSSSSSSSSALHPSLVHLRDLNRRVLEHDLELRSSLLSGGTQSSPTAGAHPIVSRAAAAAAWANSAEAAEPTRISPKHAQTQVSAPTMHGYSSAATYFGLTSSPLLGSSFAAATPPSRFPRSASLLSSSSASGVPSLSHSLSSVPECSSMPSPYRNLHVRTATAASVGSTGGGGEGHSIGPIETDRSPRSPPAPLSARSLSASRAAAKARAASSERKAWQKAAGVWK